MKKSESNQAAFKGKLDNFWEPLYNPTDSEPFPETDWDFRNTTGIRHNTCDSQTLKSYIKGKNRYHIRDIKFTECHFKGEFDFVPIAFTNCEFLFCDLGSSKWEKIKFHGCKFKKCSFTMLTLSQCQFIDCDWDEIGMSGTETRMYRTSITNPQQFIHSAYTCLDKHILAQKNANPSYQKMRLELTKAKLARILLKNLEGTGDDKSYYEAKKTHVNQSINARIAEAKHNVFSKRKKLWSQVLIRLYQLENLILNVSGGINGWGYSVARPAIIGVSLIIFFGFLYYLLGISTSLTSGMVAGFDVTLLFGYTKQANNQMSVFVQLLMGLNALLGLWWYAVFVPTIVNRISQVRG